MNPEARTAPPTRPAKKKTKLVVGAVTLLILAYTGVVMAPMFGMDGFSLPTFSLYSPEAAARWEARKAVEARLTSPGSARFEEWAVAARTADERFFVVYVVVDSQNKLGAVLRSHALALVMAGKDSDEGSQVLHLELTEESPRIVRIKELTTEIGEGWAVEEWVEG